MERTEGILSLTENAVEMEEYDSTVVPVYVFV